MGSQCTKISSKTILKAVSGRLQSQESQIVNCNQSLHLQIKLQNLILTNLIDVVQKIVFTVDKVFQVTFSKNEFHVQEKTLRWNASHSRIFQIAGEDLDKKHMKVLIYDHKDKISEKLEFKMTQLCTGPSRQDHLLQKMKARLAFDILITQRVSIIILLNKFNIQFLPSQIQQNQQFGYSICLKTSQDDKIFQTQPIFQNARIENINHKLNAQILSHTLRQSTLIIQIWKKDPNLYEQHPNRVNHYSDIYLSYQRVMTSIFTSIFENQKQLQRRKIQFQQIVMVDGINIGTAKFQLIVDSSKLYVQQMECLTFSQLGIGTVSPQQLICEKEAIDEINELKVQIQKLKSMIKYTSKQKNALKKSLAKIYEITNRQCKISFSVNTELYNFQVILIQTVDIVVNIMRGGQDIMNQNLWKIIDTILHRPQLTIRYIYFHLDQKDRNQISIKLYVFICKVLQKIIQSTTIGVTYHELKCIQKFIAFAYFRLPWVQNNILKYFQRQEDPQINCDKLIQFGASLAAKSPSKSIVYDWDSSIYKTIINKDQFKKALNEIEQLTFEIPDWNKILFNRQDDDLFYGLYIQIWIQAENTLTYNGTIRWQYFPKYGQLLAAFLGQMNKSPLIQYSSQFKQCSQKLVTNQKLLNSFMMLLFPKTCLYQSYCVMKCLDLIKGYFQVITKKKRRMPLDFNFNYFYTGIKIILDSTHSFLLVKGLSLLYDYYNLFSLEFKMTLNAFILGKPFFNLFLHWCSHVRKTFYYLLYFRIKPFFIQNLKQNTIKMSLNSIDQKKMYHQYDNLIHSLQKLQSQIMKGQKKQGSKETQYYLYMKEKIKKKMQEKFVTPKKSPLSVAWNEEMQNRRKVSEMKQIQFFKVRRWSMSSSDEIDTNEIPNQKKKYVIRSMKQFRGVMQQKDPNGKVSNIQKMFDDGGASIDS